MPRKALRGFGILHTFDTFKDVEGMRIARDFLASTMESFTKVSRKLRKVGGDSDFLPFIWRERQLAPALYIAIYNLPAAVLGELPTRRDIHGANAHGWVDCWARYRGIVFLLEFKHDYCPCRPVNGFNKSLYTKWNEACVQLGQIKRSVARDQNDGNGVLVKLPLFVVVHYAGSNDQNAQSKLDQFRLQCTEKALLQRHNQLCRALGPQMNRRPAWSGLWILPEEWVKSPVSAKGERYEIYPALSFFSLPKVVPKSRENL